jgi:arylsulfatase A-like enzyme
VRKAGDGYDYVPGWGPAEDLPGGGELSIDLYDDEVCYVDHCVGQVRAELEELGLWDETAVIVTADHGEDLDLHGLWGHGTVHDTTVRVPLIIRDPKSFPQGRRLRGFVQHADDLPTILEYFTGGSGSPLNAESERMPEIPETFDGASLRELIRGERAAPEEIVVESGAHRGYVSHPWKLIWYKEERPSELFNLENDPLEIHDRAAEAPAVRKELEGKLAAWVEKQLAGERTDPIFAVQGAWTCYIGKKGDR